MSDISGLLEAAAQLQAEQSAQNELAFNQFVVKTTDKPGEVDHVRLLADIASFGKTVPEFDSRSKSYQQRKAWAQEVKVGESHSGKAMAVLGEINQLEENFKAVISAHEAEVHSLRRKMKEHSSLHAAGMTARRMLLSTIGGPTRTEFDTIERDLRAQQESLITLKSEASDTKACVSSLQRDLDDNRAHPDNARRMEPLKVSLAKQEAEIETKQVAISALIERRSTLLANEIIDPINFAESR